MAERYTPNSPLEILGPNEQPELYSTLVLGSVVSPPILSISGHDRWKNWDKQKASGSTGATTKLKGDDPGEFTVTFYLATADDRATWAAFRLEVDSTVSGDTPQAKPIYHPDLSANGFTEVVSGGVGGATHDATGGTSVAVKFLEYYPPKPKRARSAQASGSTASAVSSQEADPNAARRARVEALYEEASAP